jgi:hypothetical protein
MDLHSIGTDGVAAPPIPYDGDSSASPEPWVRGISDDAAPLMREN